MCGRFVLKTSLEQLQVVFGVQRLKYTVEPSYNIAPTQAVAAVVQNAAGTRGLVSLKWGLIPPWATDESGAAKMINARSESVHEKPSFREAFCQRRCLIPADGFFEWKKGDKQPVYIHDVEDQPLAFAGIYSFWHAPQGERIATCAILTTAANATIDAIHHRMPVILDAQSRSLWLNKATQQPDQLLPLLTAYPAERTAWRYVDPAVNKVRVNTPHNIAPYTPDTSSEVSTPQQTELLTDLFQSNS
jgi:putative SOS response-associated peptidase YedK